VPAFHRTDWNDAAGLSRDVPRVVGDLTDVVAVQPPRSSLALLHLGHRRRQWRGSSRAAMDSRAFHSGYPRGSQRHRTRNPTRRFRPRASLALTWRSTHG
jgi:hypothetical protein